MISPRLGLLPNDYNILRADRTNGCRGGGVALIFVYNLNA